MADADELSESLDALSKLLLAEESLDDTLRRVSTLACRALPGCDMSGVTLMRDDQPVTAAFEDERAELIDRAQYAAGDGPCLTAFRTQEVVRSCLDDEERWPEFRTAALGVGVHSVLGVPLIANGQSVGALNLYSHSSDGFTEADEDTARLFSEQAGIACANAEVFWRTFTMTEQLLEALESRDVIGQAKGILMARRSITANAAFHELRRASQERNIKLREVAELVVYTGELPEG